MVFAEAAMALPLLASYAWHSGVWKNRPRRAFAKMFKESF
jgi:deoxyhypusine synthase